MWNPLSLFKPKPRSPEEHCWRFVSKGLVSDAKLFADGMEVAGRPACGAWARMTIECEIAALRLWAIAGAIAIGSKERADHLSQATEQRLGDWFSRKRPAQLAAYAAFNRVAVPETLDALSMNWRRYLDVPHNPGALEDTLSGLLAIFWGRCLVGYTNKPADHFAGQKEATIDLFVPTYLKAQMLLALSAVSKIPDSSGNPTA